MAQFKKITDVMRAYVDALDRWTTAGLSGNLPWKCDGQIFSSVPSFNIRADKYEIPVSILEGKPVFIGDNAWHKDGRKLVADSNGWFDTISATLEINFGLTTESLVLSWTKPEKKTIKIYGWLNTETGGTATSIFDTKEAACMMGTIFTAQMIRYQKLDHEIEL